MQLHKSNKFDPNTDVPDLSGKTFIVTGGSAGIGFGIVAHLLQHHASRIILLSNKEEHAAEAISELRDWGEVDAVEWQQCDLADLEQTNNVARKLRSELKRLDAIVCNAGLGVGKYAVTNDGLDSHFQVNHLSQMLLTMLLLPVLLVTPNARIVLQSSEFHRFGTGSVKFETKDEINQDIGPSPLYARTKLAQILFARALHRRLISPPAYIASIPNRAGTVWINSTHPGAVETPQQEQAKDAYGIPGRIGVAMIRPFMKDPIKKGCRSALFAATSEDVIKESINAQYIVPDREVKEVTKQAQDEHLGESLWRLSEGLIKERLGSLPWDREQQS